jgi:hypothetical protein
MKRKSLLTPEQEALLKSFNKDYKKQDDISLNENERVKNKNLNNNKSQFRRGSNIGR